MKIRDAVVVLVVILSAVIPTAAYAQSDITGAIAGTAKDDTGAVLPGVTVEAASPALIEKVRSVVTDAQGNFIILDLRSGMYTITFTLPGFSTFRREGIEVRTAFTATVNAEMKVGALEETITVTGAAPAVDVRNVRSENLLSRKVLDNLPNAQTMQAFASLVVGTTVRAGSQDVGGNRGELFSSVEIHGVRQGDMRLMMDGMSFNKGGDFGGGVRWYQANQLSTQEVVLTTTGSMESETGGIQMNYVPKEGGNTIRLTALGNYTNSHLQMSNINDDLRSRGQRTPADAKYVYDTGIGIGGPLKRDKLWWYSGQRSWGAAQNLGGTSAGYFNATQTAFPPKYTPDFDRPTYRKTAQRDHNIRLTAQVSPRHKVNGAFYFQKGCTCFAQVEGKAPEGARYHVYYPNNVAQATWNHPRTNRLMFEAGAGYVRSKGNLNPVPDAGVGPDSIGINDLTTGLSYRSITSSPYGIEDQTQWAQRASMSYVTGSHAFRLGTGIWEAQAFFLDSYWIGNQNWNLRDGVSPITGQVASLPVSLIQYASPYTEKLRVSPNIGIYASDQWTLRRLTVNGGVRWDYIDARALAVSRKASTFVPAAEFPQVDHIPQWNDWSVRTGAAYDVFGNGRTAVKGAFGKYLAAAGLGVAVQNSPVTQTVKSANRTWNDANGNFVPDCDFSIQGATGECGPISNANFGRQVITTRWQPDLLKGSGDRDYNYQASASFQHEILTGLALNVSYYRTWYRNFKVTDNLAVTPADYDPFCVTAPVDTRLPGGGGQQICGFFDIKPEKFGLVDNLIVKSENFGEQSEVYNGLDFTVNARFGLGGTFQGGVNTGQTVTDSCDIGGILPVGATWVPSVDSPQKRFCKQTNPWSNQLQAKFSSSYPLPWYGLQASGVFQMTPGIPILATYVASNAQIAPTLGRNLGQCRGAATCTGTVIVDLIEPFTMSEKRLKQLDLRLAKTIRFKRGSLLTTFDVYNVLNNASVLSDTTRYGPSWLQSVELLGPRMFKFGGQYDF